MFCTFIIWQYEDACRERGVGTYQDHVTHTMQAMINPRPLQSLQRILKEYLLGNALRPQLIPRFQYGRKSERARAVYVCVCARKALLRCTHQCIIVCTDGCERSSSYRAHAQGISLQSFSSPNACETRLLNLCLQFGRFVRGQCTSIFGVKHVQTNWLVRRGSVEKHLQHN